MTRRTSILAALGLPGLLLAGSLWLERRSPPPTAAGGPGAGPRLLEREQRRSALLEEDRHVLIWSSAAKRWVAGTVIRRRLGLREGAAVLRAIDARRPARLRPDLPDAYLGSRDPEGYCRSMLGWVRGELGPGGGDPARVADLEAELAQSLALPGPLRLPDVSLDQCLPPDLLPVPAAPQD